MSLLDRQHRAKLYWWGILFYFALLSFNALATCTLAAFTGAKWELLTLQERIMIGVAIGANWTGLVLAYLRSSLARMVAGKDPISTGDTEHLNKT